MEDLTGQKFGRLTVLKFHHKKQIYNHEGKKNGNKIFWLCKCECGNDTIVSAGHLKNGTIRSCGCIQKEVMKQKMQKHKLSQSRIYRIYHKMKSRCYKKTDTRFLYYGARGITICKEWLDDFMNFYEWAIENGYKENLTIDRIDVTGNYEPNNCRWVDMKVQSNNTRKNINIFFNNEVHTLKEWSEILNINYNTLHKRITKYKWSIRKAFDEIS